MMPTQSTALGLGSITACPRVASGRNQTRTKRQSLVGRAAILRRDRTRPHGRLKPEEGNAQDSSQDRYFDDQRLKGITAVGLYLATQGELHAFMKASAQASFAGGA